MFNLYQIFVFSLFMILFVSTNFGQGVSAEQLKILELLDKKKIEFQNTKNDSIFITQNSDSPYRYIYLRRGDEPEDVEEELFKAKPGQVVGPFKSGKHNYLFKIIQHDSIRYRMRISHIFVKTEGLDKSDTLESYTKAQKIARSLNKGESFDELLQKEGSDFKQYASSLNLIPENVASDGDIGWIWEGTTPPEVNNALVRTKKGEAVAAKTSHGAHVFFIKNKEQGYYKTKIVSVVKKIK